MTVTELFVQVNAAYRGTDDDPPTSGPDFILWLATANRKQGEFSRDSRQAWQSTFSVDTLADPVAAGTQTYDLGTTILVPSDKVYVTTADNRYTFVVCKPEERERFANSVYISGSNPQKLTFVDTIDAASPWVGGVITMAGWHLLPDLVDGDSLITVDDPYWLTYAVASELAFNDLTYSDKSPDLNAKANNLYSQMARNNRAGTNNMPRTSQTNVNRILGPESETGIGSL